MSTGSAPVAIFNANSQPVQVQVNAGTLVSILGTGPTQLWAPQQAGTSPWTYSNGFPAKDVFGSMGQNQVNVLVNGVVIGQSVPITIPQSGPVFSLQLYIFFNTTSTVSWTLLSSGQPVGSGTALTASALMLAAKESASGKKPSSKKKPSKKSAKKR